MADRTVVLDPVTRLEGHMRIELDVQDGAVASARSSGTSFRGIETVVLNRDPRDAAQITQRVCGVCPIPHATASSYAVEMAAGHTVNDQGRLLRNIVQCANYLESHLLSFYTLSLPDYIAGLPAAGNWPVGEPARAWKGGDSLDAARMAANSATQLAIRRKCHGIGALAAGRMPHPVGIVPGGATARLSAAQKATAKGLAEEVRAFIDGSYAQDVQDVADAFPEYLDIGASGADFLSFGAFPDASGGRLLPRGLVPAAGGSAEDVDPLQVMESVASSRYVTGSPVHPQQGVTEPDLDKAGAYSWIKSPRLDGKVCEVGPLARAMVAGTAPAQRGAMARHLARQQEASLLAAQLISWIDAIQPDTSAFDDLQMPDSGQGAGLNEAPRGALGHWLTITDGLLSNYHIISPTTWNGSPRDDQGQPGALEAALAGVELADPDEPIEVYRIIRSFDPCLQCAVH